MVKSSTLLMITLMPILMVLIITTTTTNFNFKNMFTPNFPKKQTKLQSNNYHENTLTKPLYNENTHLTKYRYHLTKLLYNENTPTKWFYTQNEHTPNMT